jgi:hypothetical protein
MLAVGIADRKAVKSNEPAAQELKEVALQRPILALELTRGVEQVEAVKRYFVKKACPTCEVTANALGLDKAREIWGRELRSSLRSDAALVIPCYGLLFLLFGVLLLYQNFRNAELVGGALIFITLAAMAFDYRENYGLNQVLLAQPGTPSAEALKNIWGPSVVKWALLFVAQGWLAVFFWQLRDWLRQWLPVREQQDIKRRARLTMFCELAAWLYCVGGVAGLVWLWLYVSSGTLTRWLGLSVILSSLASVSSLLALLSAGLLFALTPGRLAAALDPQAAEERLLRRAAVVIGLLSIVGAGAALSAQFLPRPAGAAVWVFVIALVLWALVLVIERKRATESVTWGQASQAELNAYRRVQYEVWGGYLLCALIGVWALRVQPAGGGVFATGGVLLSLWLLGFGLKFLFAPSGFLASQPVAQTDQPDKQPIPFFQVLLDEYESQRRTHRLPALIGDERRAELAARKKDLDQAVLEPAERAKREAEINDELEELDRLEHLKNQFDEVEWHYREFAEREELRDQCVKVDRQQLNRQLVAALYRQLHRQASRRAALCFSGGGVRSATFVLGVLQGLAKQGIRLGQFHFLSTVSGGGYTGSWLTVWLHRAGLARVQQDLEESGAPNPLDPEPAPLQHLRRYSNPLTPSLGLMSADTWALVGTYLRNLSLNWVVLLPLLMAFLAVPRLAMAFACWNDPTAECLPWLPVVGLLAGVIAVGYIVANRPSLARQHTIKQFKVAQERLRKDEVEFLLFGLAFLWLAAVASTAFWAWLHIKYKDGAKIIFDPLWLGLAVVLIGAAALARLLWVGDSRQKKWPYVVAVLITLLGLVSLFAPGLLRYELSSKETGVFILFALALYGGGIYLSWLIFDHWDRREFWL